MQMVMSKTKTINSQEVYRKTFRQKSEWAQGEQSSHQMVPCGDRLSAHLWW